MWHFDYNENVENSTRLSNYLDHASTIRFKLEKDPTDMFSFKPGDVWHGCFGVQSYINHEFLSHIQNKYQIFRLLNYVLTRTDRCSLERVMGVIFHLESPSLHKHPSLLGNILKCQGWGYSFEEYCANYKQMRKPLVKVWTGR